MDGIKGGRAFCIFPTNHLSHKKITVCGLCYGRVEVKKKDTANVYAFTEAYLTDIKKNISLMEEPKTN